MHYYEPLQEQGFDIPEGRMFIPFKGMSPNQQKLYLSRYLKPRKYNPLNIDCGNYLHGARARRYVR